MSHYDYAGAAEQLGLDSPSWLQSNISDLPHRRFGKFVRFSDEDIAEISAMHAVRPRSECPMLALPQALLDLKPGRVPRRRTAGGER